MPDTAPSPEPAYRAASPVPVLGWWAEIRLAFAFLTCLPVRLTHDEAVIPVGAAVRAFPIAGLAVGLIASAVYALADLLGMSGTVAAALAVAAMVVVGGGLHEDGLADTADGLGGRGREHALEIMRDSHIGSFGVMALVFVQLLRVTALSYAGSVQEAVLMLIAAAAGSRAVVPAVMYMLPPARSDGLGRAAGQPDRRRVVDAGALGVIFVLGTAPVVWDLAWRAAAVLSAILVTAAAAGFARKRFGGQTGDILGAIQQLAEVAILLACVASPTWI
jgi:adenosylcobinamide-GDP ribazoletransferase